MRLHLSVTCYGILDHEYADVKLVDLSKDPNTAEYLVWWTTCEWDAFEPMSVKHWARHALHQIADQA